MKSVKMGVHLPFSEVVEASLEPRRCSGRYEKHKRSSKVS